MSGKVYLVGAGPGDPELLTLKGRRALEEAEVVVYDRLANPRLLELAPAGAERIYAGKEAQQPAITQDEINALLVERGRAGRTVCRLKGGDPFLFGRGGEEAEALAAAGIEWEYVPGVTSAIAVPGYAGIPVTQRGLCSTLAIITGHEDPAKGEPTTRWEGLADSADTLVLLMGVEALPGIVERLLAHGRSPQTPAAVVSWGTYPHQQTVFAELEELVERCRAAGIAAPAVTIVGEVAALRERLRWWDARPLFGKRIVVTRPLEQAGGLRRLLEEAGAEVKLCPATRIQPLPDLDLSSFAAGFDWVVFTSANGVRCLAEALKKDRRDFRALGLAKIAAIGPETARAAEEAGLWVDFVPSQYVAEQVAAELPEALPGKRVLIPRAREARELLPELWRKQGAVVEVLPVYASVPDEAGLAALGAALAAGAVDALTFAASSAVRAVVDAMDGQTAEFAGVRIACIGPVTAATARAVGFAVGAEAESFTAAGLVTALELLFSNGHATEVNHE